VTYGKSNVASHCLFCEILAWVSTFGDFRQFWQSSGKNLMQERVLCEIRTIFENVDADIANGLKEHNLFGHVDIAIGSIINAFLFGYRFSDGRQSEFFDLKVSFWLFLTIKQLF
jgi:hypothetical protein